MKTKIIKNLMLRYSGLGFILLSILLVLVLLGRAYFRIGTVARDDLLKTIELSVNNGIKTRFYLNRSVGKPEILSTENYSILNYDAKDSSLAVDGQKYSLWDLVSNYGVDSRKKELFYTTSTNEDKLKRVFTIEQNLKMVDKNKVEVFYYFIWTAPENVTATLQNVNLELTHSNLGVSGLGEEEKLVRGQTEISSRRPKVVNQPVSYIPFEVNLEGDVTGKDLSYRKTDLSSGEGVNGFVIRYSLSSPPRAKRNLIAKETITLKPAYP